MALTQVSDQTRANVVMALSLLTPEVRRLVSATDTESGAVLLEWEARKGYVSLEIGDISYTLTYVPDEIDGTQWGSNGSMANLSLLRGKLTSVMPAWDKVNIRRATVLLFNREGRFVTEESWSIPDGEDGPWSLKSSSDFHRIDGGAVLVEVQEPWGFPYLIV